MNARAAVGVLCLVVVGCSAPSTPTGTAAVSGPLASATAANEGASPPPGSAAGSSASATSPAPTAAPVSGGIRFVRQLVTDPQINGIDAYSVLVPEGWTFTGKVEWRHDMANLAASILTVEDPSSGAAIETFWPVQYDYAQPLLMPVGSNWLGAIVKEPMPAKEYVAKILLPQYRPGAKVVSVESLPNVAKAVRSGLQPVAGGTVDADAVRVRISTKHSGVAFDEDFYVTVAYSAAGGVYQWGPVSLYSFRAPAGTLDAATPILEAITSSGQVTPLWSANYQIVYGLFVQGQYAAVQAAGQLSQHLAQNNDEITASLRSGYEAQQAAEDRIFDGYSEYIQGLDRYDVPDIGVVSLPSAFNACSSSGAGVVLVPLLSTCPDDTTLLQPKA